MTRSSLLSLLSIITVSLWTLFLNDILYATQRPLIYEMLSGKQRKAIRKIPEGQQIVRWHSKGFEIESTDNVEKLKNRGWTAYVITTAPTKGLPLRHNLLYIERYAENGCVEFIATDFVLNQHLGKFNNFNLLTSYIFSRTFSGKIRHSSGKEKTFHKSIGNNVFFQLSERPRDWSFRSASISNAQFKMVQTLVETNISNPPLFSFNPRRRNTLNCKKWIMFILKYIGLEIEFNSGLDLDYLLKKSS